MSICLIRCFNFVPFCVTTQFSYCIKFSKLFNRVRIFCFILRKFNDFKLKPIKVGTKANASENSSTVLHWTRNIISRTAKSSTHKKCIAIKTNACDFWIPFSLHPTSFRCFSGNSNNFIQSWNIADLKECWTELMKQPT